MPLPILVWVIGAGVSAYLGRKAHDAWAEHPPLEGYCSNCGSTCAHAFHAPGMNWKKSGASGVLFGAAGLGVSSLVARNVYKCATCGSLTLQCRLPGCTNMALTGEYYDEEFCGQCMSSNDRSKFYKACQDQQTLARVKEVMKQIQGEIDVLKARLRELERDRQTHVEAMRQLTGELARRTAALEKVRRGLAA